MTNGRTAKTVAAVHDLSCLGRCALTVVIPTLAAMGVQPVPLPTAVLSTHTGGFAGMASRDLSGFIPECIEHWKQLGVRLDAVYSGYLASVGQADVVKELIDWQRRENGALAVVDPVMGDEGQMYSAIPHDMPAHMKELCDEADLITPTLTEAALMLDAPYPEGEMDHESIFRFLKGVDARCTVLTSVRLEGSRYANAYRERGEEGFWLCPYRRVPVHYPGTGDLFASVLTGALTGGEPIHAAVALASDFVRRVMEESYLTDAQPRYGVQLELALKYLIDRQEPEEKPVFIAMNG